MSDRERMRAHIRAQHDRLVGLIRGRLDQEEAAPPRVGVWHRGVYAAGETNHVLPITTDAARPVKTQPVKTERLARGEKYAMSFVSVPPYIVTEEDGSRARIRIPVSTPAALVFVDSPAPGRFVVHNQDRSGANVAIHIARSYVQKHRAALDGLYVRISSALP